MAGAYDVGVQATILSSKCNEKVHDLLFLMTSFETVENGVMIVWI
jgi:hypothetical protein